MWWIIVGLVCDFLKVLMSSTVCRKVCVTGQGLRQEHLVHEMCVCVSACMCILINTCNNFYSHKSHYCLWKVKTRYLYINRKPLMYRLRLWCLILCLFNHSLTVTTFRDTWGNFWNSYQNCNSMTKQLSCPLVTCTCLRQLTVLAQRGHLQPSSAPLRLNWE